MGQALFKRFKVHLIILAIYHRGDNLLRLSRAARYFAARDLRHGTDDGDTDLLES
jgi:hypothetical protein